jgi:hypothetical protein
MQEESRPSGVVKTEQNFMGYEIFNGRLVGVIHTTME